MKPCVKCGSTIRMPDGRCRPCRIASIKRRASNPVQPRPCIKCGKTERDKYNHCLPCNREGLRKAYAAKKAEHNARAKKAYEARRDYYLEKHREWHKQNPERAKALSAKWNEANPGAMTARGTAWRRNNPEKARAAVSKYRSANPDVGLALNHAYRARQKQAQGKFTSREWKALKASYHGRCVYCGNAATTADHVVPISRGGSNSIENIAPACRPCNSSKNDTSLLAWLVKRVAA